MSSSVIFRALWKHLGYYPLKGGEPIMGKYPKIGIGGEWCVLYVITTGDNRCMVYYCLCKCIVATSSTLVAIFHKTVESLINPRMCCPIP